MERKNTIRLAFVVALTSQAAMLSWSTALAQSASDVVGTWTLVSSVSEQDGTKTDQFGTGAKGMMTLDSDGHFMLTISGPTFQISPQTIALRAHQKKTRP